MAPRRSNKNKPAQAPLQGLNVQIIDFSDESTIHVEPIIDPQLLNALPPFQPDSEPSQLTAPSQPSQPNTPSPTPIEDQPDRIEWTNTMIHTLFAELVDQALDGKRADSGFKKEAWDSVVKEVQKVYIGPYVLTLQKVKQKEQAFKALYKDWRWLRDQSGFGWDEETRIITACDQAWDNVITVSYFFIIIPYLQASLTYYRSENLAGGIETTLFLILNYFQYFMILQ